MSTRNPAQGIEIVEESLASLAHYADVRSAFEVTRVLDISRDGLFVVSERVLECPYVKDYDLIKRERPARWASMFDVSNWGVLAARTDGRRVGGATLAFDSAGLDILDGRRDLAALWDIRVSPEMRGRGVGCALFRAAETWAAARACRQLTIETQNVNVPACRFYARQGCSLVSMDPVAYPEFPDEVQMIWRKHLGNALPG